MNVINFIFGILILMFGVFAIILANKTTRANNNFGNIIKIYVGGFLGTLLGVTMIINEIIKIT